MKTNKMMRIASVLLVAVLLTTCVISGTFAKYTETVDATAKADVAKWDIQFVGESTEKEFTFDLFANIVDTVDGATDDDVATGKIAPGTKGNCTIEFTNASEVNVKYTLKSLVLSDEDFPIVFSLTGNEDSYVSAAEFVTAVNAQDTDVEMGQDGEISIYWMWAFDGDDGADTAIGEAATGTEDLTITATVTVDQVN